MFVVNDHGSKSAINTNEKTNVIKKFFKKTFYYFSIFTIVFSTTTSFHNQALAADVTLTQQTANAGNRIVGANENDIEAADLYTIADHGTTSTFALAAANITVAKVTMGVGNTNPSSLTTSGDNANVKLIVVENTIIKIEKK